jgi:alpha-glucosidase
MASDEVVWWKRAVIYQIYPRSFADGNGDGIGDLAGISGRLDHLSWLGVDALWLSPFFRSPQADFGYDVSDHCDVDPIYGTVSQAERLIRECQRRRIRVLLDFVPNHTSDQHPWFLQSRSSRTNPKRDWYIWRDPAPDGGPPTNWWAAFTGTRVRTRNPEGELETSIAKPERIPEEHSAWTFDPLTRQYYLHTFLPQQPDLNWRNPEVVEAQRSVLRFWLDRGVDGFRVDAISAIGKPRVFENLPAGSEFLSEAFCTDDALVEEALAALRAIIDEYDDAVMLGETADPEHVGERKCSFGMNLYAAYGLWRAPFWRSQIEVTESIQRPDYWPGWVLSNHDIPRHADRYGSRARARAAAVLLLTLRGTPLLYAGEELGLLDADIPPDRRLDPGNRDGSRAPIPWEDRPDHGWGPAPWLPWPRNHESDNFARLSASPGSILHLYRDLITTRRASAALASGDFNLLESPDSVLAYRRAAAEDQRIVLVNFAATVAAVAVQGQWTIEVSTDPARRGQSWDGRLAPDEAVILSPRKS